MLLDIYLCWILIVGCNQDIQPYLYAFSEWLRGGGQEGQFVLGSKRPHNYHIFNILTAGSALKCVLC